MTEPTRPWCNICGHTGAFLLSDAGREGSLCVNCGASARQRALLLALGTWLGVGDRPIADWPTRPELTGMEASGRGAYPALLADKLAYHNTNYRPNHAGDQRPLEGCADLERLAYADATLDLVLAADVFEHVRRDERAFREIYRVLRPGGLLLFTVPYDADRAQTLVRVRVDGDVDVLLEEPEYHGGGGQGLAYRMYGSDLPGRLAGVGFAVALWYVDAPEHGIPGEPVFASMKASYVDLGRFVRRAPAPARPATPAIPLLPVRMWTIAKVNLGALRQLARELRARTLR